MNTDKSLARLKSSGATQRPVLRAVSRRRQVTTKAVAATPTLHPSGVLSASQVAQFKEQGYLALPGFASLEECAALKQRISTLIQDFDPKAHRTIFSTTKQTVGQYFLDSAGNISYFLEEKAFDEAGDLKGPKELCINKIGHALHDLDPVFRSFSRSPAVCDVLRSLQFQRPLPVQSMYIFKQPHIGGEVVPHQDSSFIYTEPMSCVGLWWALEDANKENGCLWALPGVHKEGLKRRFLWGPDGKVFFDAPQPEYDLTQFKPVECPAGTLVLLHGENVHYSCENTSPVSRHSYSMHVVESAPGWTWTADNWAHRKPDQPWEPFYDDTKA